MELLRKFRRSIFESKAGRLFGIFALFYIAARMIFFPSQMEDVFIILTGTMFLLHGITDCLDFYRDFYQKD